VVREPVCDETIS